MGNFSGKINLLKVKVDIKNPKEGLVEIITSLDSDYEDYAEQIADNIINDPDNDDVVEMIDAVLGGRFGEVMIDNLDGEEIDILEELSTWILNNSCYCSGYESEIVHCGDHELVIVSYGT